MTIINLGLFWSKGTPGKGFEGIRTLSEDEAASLRAACRTVEKFSDRPMFVLEIENFRSVLGAIDDLMRMVPSFGPNSRVRIGPEEVGNRVAVWLQTMTMLINQTRAEIKRKFGKPSVQLSEWESLVNSREDSEAGFGFLRQIRNLLHGRPVPLNFNISVNERGTSATLFLDEATLRKDYKMAGWLDDHPQMTQENMELLPLVNSAQSAIEELKLHRMRLDLHEARAAAKIVMSFAEEMFEHGDPIRSWPFAFKYDADPQEENLRFEEVFFLPLEVLDLIPTSDDFRDLIIPSRHGEEAVGPNALRVGRPYRSFTTEVVFSSVNGAVKGEAHIWVNTVGPGWGATVLLDGYVPPGTVTMLTKEGHKAKATLDNVTYRGGGDLTVVVASLIGLGSPPPPKQLTHSFREDAIAADLETWI